MGRKRKNILAGLVFVFSGLLWGQERDRGRDTSAAGDRRVTEECFLLGT